MGMMSLRRRMFERKGGNLPYDAEIEFLQSYGTQYIDTGIALKDIRNWMVECDIMRLNNTAIEQPIFSTWTSAYNETNTFIQNGYSDQVGSLDQYDHGHFTISGFIRNSVLHIKSGKDLDGIYGIGPNCRFIAIDNNLITKSLDTVSTNPTTLKLYCRADLAQKSTLRIYSFQLYIDASKIIDYIPVRVGTTGYLYDKVSGELFGNQGTGAFILGPDKN